MSNLTVKDRSNTKPKQLRREGVVPMALIERGKPSRMLEAPSTELKQALLGTSGAGRIDLKIEGEDKPRTVIVKQVDVEPITLRLMHVAVMQVRLDDITISDIPVIGVGHPAAVESEEGVLSAPTSTIKVKGKVKDIPDHIEIDISNMQIGDSISAGDAPLAEGLELSSSADATLFSLQVARAVELEAPAEEEGGEPERVGEEGEAAEGGDSPEGEG
jgi:large subunit ribosomal protein L25